MVMMVVGFYNKQNIHGCLENVRFPSTILIACNAQLIFDGWSTSLLSNHNFSNKNNKLNELKILGCGGNLGNKDFNGMKLKSIEKGGIFMKEGSRP